MTTKTRKEPFGRPSTYPSTDEDAKALCDRVIALGSEGKSEVQISAAIDIPRTTMRSWGERYTDFSSALARAKDLEQVWWEDRAQTNLENRDFNAGLWHKNVASRFRAEYGDAMKLSGDKESPIQHAHAIEWIVVDPGADGEPRE